MSARRLLRLLLVILVVVASSRDARAQSTGDTPAAADEHVILRTIAGDLVLTLYPSVAPQTVEQFLKLVRAGVYDTTAFVRVEPNFVLQLSAANDRSKPLSEDQKTLIHRIPGEFSKIPHTRGVLSMAREDGDPNSNETSFSILLGPAPHLDGKYTIFGRVESGRDADAIMTEMLRVPRGPLMRPVVRLEVDKAEVVTTSELRNATLAPPRLVPVPSELAATATAATAAAAAASPTTEAAPRGVNLEVAAGIAFICLLGLVSFALQGKVPSSFHGSLNLVVVLVSAFVLLLVLLPQGQRHPWLATLLFFGLVGLFKVLGRFERPVEIEKK